MKIDTRDIFTTETAVMPVLEQWSKVHDPEYLHYSENYAEMHRLTRGCKLHPGDEEEVKNEAWERLTYGVVRRGIEGCFGEKANRVRVYVGEGGRSGKDERDGTFWIEFKRKDDWFSVKEVAEIVSRINSLDGCEVESLMPEFTVSWSGRA